MRIRFTNTVCGRKCLQLSLSVSMMIRVAKMVNPHYNFYKRNGIRESMPISNQDVANRIITDIIEDDLYIDFIEALIQISTVGYMGTRYALKGLDNAVSELIDLGYTYDIVSGHFFENQREFISPEWGRLHEGDEKKMTVLRLDIADNSELVRQNPDPKIKKAYNDVRTIVSRAVISRIGRIWSWEGDGALAAFLFGPMEKMAVFAGMEILHELFMYNRFRNPLNMPIDLRIGAHIGKIWYSNSELERSKNETIEEVIVYESLAEINTLCVSYNLCLTMEENILSLFSEERTGRSHRYRLYNLGNEE